MTVYTTVDSPVGELLLVGETGADGGVVLTALSMPGRRNARRIEPGWTRDPAVFTDVTERIAAYFAGERVAFDFAYGPAGTAFQQRVWDALDAIPYGTTTTYGVLAAQLGVPREEVRAVGAAIGANPILLLRPCHRVIGADGALRGYAAGLDRKRALLEREGALQPTLI